MGAKEFAFTMLAIAAGVIIAQLVTPYIPKMGTGQ